MESGRTDIVFRPFKSVVDWKWFHAHVPVVLAQDAKGVIALVGGIPAAGCVMQNWLPASVEVHHVLLRPTLLRRGWLETLAEAAFGDERLCAYSLVSAWRPESLKFHTHIGFKETGRVPNGDGPGVDLVVLSVQRHEFKYFRENTDHGYKAKRA